MYPRVPVEEQIPIKPFDILNVNLPYLLLLNLFSNNMLWVYFHGGMYSACCPPPPLHAPVGACKYAVDLPAFNLIAKVSVFKFLLLYTSLQKEVFPISLTASVFPYWIIYNCIK